MKLSELILAVGDENITVQRVQDCVKAEYKAKTNDTEITFATQQITVDELMRGTCKKLGLIVWLPVDKIPKK